MTLAVGRLCWCFVCLFACSVALSCFCFLFCKCNYVSNFGHGKIDMVPWMVPKRQLLLSLLISDMLQEVLRMLTRQHFFSCHDKDTGLIGAIPSPTKGGKHFQFLVTELTRFVVSTGHREIRLRCDGEPATLSILGV